MRAQREQRKRHQGFTLVELIVVVTILALLMGLLAPRIMDRLRGGQINIAKIAIRKIGSELERAALDIGRFPTTEEGLVVLTQRASGVENWSGPYLQASDLKDPWGQPYQYRYPCQHSGQHEYDLFSTGKNLTEDHGDTSDDIRSW